MTLREYVRGLDKNSAHTLVVWCGDGERTYTTDKPIVLEDWEG